MRNNITSTCGRQQQSISRLTRKDKKSLSFKDLKNAKGTGNRCGHVPSLLVFAGRRVSSVRQPYQIMNAEKFLSDILKDPKQRKKCGVFHHTQEDGTFRKTRSEKDEVLLCMLAVLVASTDVRGISLKNSKGPTTTKWLFSLMDKNANDHNLRPFKLRRKQRALAHLVKEGYVNCVKRKFRNADGQIREASPIVSATQKFFMEIIKVSKEKYEMNCHIHRLKTYTSESDEVVVKKLSAKEKEKIERDLKNLSFLSNRFSQKEENISFNLRGTVVSSDVSYEQRLNALLSKTPASPLSAKDAMGSIMNSLKPSRTQVNLEFPPQKEALSLEEEIRRRMEHIE